VAGNGLVGGGAGAGTMEGALIQAYQNNPQLNSQRAATRATDENVPTALSGYRPRVAGTASSTENYLETLAKTNGAIGQPLPTGVPAAYSRTAGATVVNSAGVTVTQTLLNGFQTGNRTRH